MKREIITFNNKKYLLVDTIYYNGKEYLYLFEDIVDKMENKGANSQTKVEAEVNFIYKEDETKGVYTNVVDDKLFSNLMKLVSKKALTGNNDLL